MTKPGELPVPSGRKLSVFALPSYTAIIFGLIASVILGVACMALLPGSQLWWPPVIFGLTLLPLRDFLQWPDRLLRAYRSSGWRAGHGSNTGQVQDQIETALAELAPERPPALCITDMPVIIESFGTFRRRYVALGRIPAARLAQKLASDKRRQPYLAMLCHELAHFVNHDMPLARLSYSLLKMTALVMMANVGIGLLLVAFVVVVSPDILHVEFWTGMSERLASLAPGFPPIDLTWVPESLRQQNSYAFERLQDPAGRSALWLSSSLYLQGAQLPFVLVGAVLWLVYWPRLMRIRELYADARSAEMLNDADAAFAALAEHDFLRLGPAPERSTRWQRLREVWTRALWQARGLPMKLPVVGRLLALHPSPETRVRCLADPVQVFGKPHEIAVTIGLAAVLLDQATRGILTASYIYEPGPFLPGLIVFVVTAVWLLPQVCIAGQRVEQESGVEQASSGLSGLRRWWRRQESHLPVQIALVVSVIAALKVLTHFFDLGLVSFMRVTDAIGWGRHLDLWTYVMLGVGAEGPLPALMGVEVSWAQFTALHVFRPMVYFGLALPPLLFGILWADAALKRRALTWYGLGAQVRRVFWISTIVFALLLLLLVIPALNHLLFPEIYSDWSPVSVLGIVCALVVAAAGGAWFWRLDRRWAGRCPSCGQPVIGSYYPGMTCQNKQCTQALHPWLVAGY